MSSIDWTNVPATGCSIRHDGATTIMSADADGGCVAFEGAPGRVAGVDWAAGRYLVFDALDHEEWTLGVVFRLWSADGSSRGDASAPADMHITMGLMPGLPTRLSLPLSALDSQTMFMPRTPGKLKTVIVGERLDPARIVRLELGVMPAHAPQTLSITDLRMVDAEPDYPVPDVKLVDEIGQYTGREWPGKTRSVDEMVAYLNAQYAEASAPAEQFPGRNRYGGSAAATIDATGFFRTHHDGKRWWLVDPDGAPFFSTGPDCVRPHIECPVDGIESLFRWLPPKEGDYADAWSARTPYGHAFFDFGIANLIRAFGADWRDRWEAITARRLRGWGFNTIANWSDRGITRTAGLPYVWPLVDFPTTKKTIFRDFPDVFDDEFERNATRFAAQLDDFRGDPLLIGYFLRNEPTWAFVRGLNIAEEVLATTDAPASRRALADHLSRRYGGDVAKFNAAWSVGLSSFAELETRIIPHASRASAVAHDDLIAFSRIMIRRYVELPSQACRRVDPDHLNLGMRYAYVASDLLLEGSDCFDVFSINCYQMDPTDHIDAVGKAVNLPIMIGEYHFGALDRGLVANALRGVESQADRGIGYRYYLERAAANPYCVGAHYFTVADEATLGRYDGENWNIGIEDVCRRPYVEFVDG
ncbi:MAG: hypothetical protein EA382_01760, partial [Spirochaetaceae bacterium]